MTGFPPVAESPTPEVPCQLSHPPPPPPPMHQLKLSLCLSHFLFPPVPAHPNRAAPASSLSPSTPPPPSRESIYVLIVCIVMMKLCVGVLCCQVIQPDLHMVRTTAIHGWLTRLELYLCTDLLSCHSVFTIPHFFPTLHYSMHPPKSNNFLDLTARGMCSMNI